MAIDQVDNTENAGEAVYLGFAKVNEAITKLNLILANYYVGDGRKLLGDLDFDSHSASNLKSAMEVRNAAEFPTIKAAADDLGGPGIVIIPAGAYTENMVLSASHNNIWFLGQGKPTWNISGVYGIDASAATGVIFDGISFCGSDPLVDEGLSLGAKNVVRNCIFDSNFYVVIRAGNHCRIYDNELQGAGAYDNGGGDSVGRGILTYGDDVYILNNKISATYDMAICVSLSHEKVFIKGNEIKSFCGWGVGVGSGSGVIIEGNLFYDQDGRKQGGGEAISCYGTGISNVSIANNVILNDSLIKDSAGIQIKSSAEVVENISIVGNVIQNTKAFGITIVAKDATSLIRNVSIIGNVLNTIGENGVDVSQDAGLGIISNVTVQGNTIRDWASTADGMSGIAIAEGERISIIGNVLEFNAAAAATVCAIKGTTFGGHQEGHIFITGNLVNIPNATGTIYSVYVNYLDHVYVLGNDEGQGSISINNSTGSWQNLGSEATTISPAQLGALGALVEWTAWVPTLTGGADLSGYDTARYYRIGNICFFYFVAYMKDVTTTGTIQITLPFTTPNINMIPVSSQVYDGSTWLHPQIFVRNAANYMTVSKTVSGGVWAGDETNVRIYISGFFEIA